MQSHCRDSEESVISMQSHCQDSEIQLQQVICIEALQGSISISLVAVALGDQSSTKAQSESNHQWLSPQQALPTGVYQQLLQQLHTHWTYTHHNALYRTAPVSPATANPGCM